MGSFLLGFACFAFLSAFAKIRAEIEDRFYVSVDAPFIVNGENATWGQFPWQVSLELPADDNTTDLHFCGGTLVHESWVITAAHCILAGPRALTVLANVLVRSEDRLEVGQFSDVYKVWVHEGYDPNSQNISYPNDIALVKLATPMELNENVQPLPLPMPGDDFVGRTCQISGWGTLRGPIEFPSDILKYTDTSVISLDQCQELVGDIGNVWDNHACVFNGVSGACSGDSGGPLSCLNAEGTKRVHAGVTSWGVIEVGVGCSVEYPTAYTKVSNYIDWILAIAPEIPAPTRD